MKRITSLVLIIAMVFVLASCSVNGDEDVSNATSNVTADTYDVLIPSSYIDYFNLDKDEYCNTFNNMGSEYVTSATVINTGIVITATQNQIDNLIKKSSKNIEKYIMEFEEYNQSYRFVESKDYTGFEMYCDELYDSKDFLWLITMVSSSYAINNILHNKNPEWDVSIKVINCHTNNVVIEGSILTESMTINDEAWEKSYAN